MEVDCAIARKGAREGSQQLVSHGTCGKGHSWSRISLNLQQVQMPALHFASLVQLQHDEKDFLWQRERYALLNAKESVDLSLQMVVSRLGVFCVGAQGGDALTRPCGPNDRWPHIIQALKMPKEREIGHGYIETEVMLEFLGWRQYTEDKTIRRTHRTVNPGEILDDHGVEPTQA